jgi:hypothetical protein
MVIRLQDHLTLEHKMAIEKPDLSGILIVSLLLGIQIMDTSDRRHVILLCFTSTLTIFLLHRLVKTLK